MLSLSNQNVNSQIKIIRFTHPQPSNRNRHLIYSVLSLWLSWTVHTLRYSPLSFWCFQPPDFVYQTFHCWFICLFCLWSINMEWPCFEGNPVWTHSNLNWRQHCYQNNRPAMLSALHCCLSLPQIPVYSVYCLLLSWLCVYMHTHL